MGAVYLAANTKAFDRPCVVKEVIEYYDRTDPDGREKAIRQFEFEARTLASLKHPGIPDIYAYFSEGGRNYLVMEHIAGKDLAQGLDDGEESGAPAGPAMPVTDVVRYAAQICDVLVYLSQRRPPVMHNDIKPANMILDPQSGRAVLVDFGTALSRYTHPAEGQAKGRQPRLYGTTGYAAPELFEGKAEPRSDVYALAATVYHLLTRDDPRAHPFQYPYLDQIETPLREVLAAALEADVGRRIDAAQFKERLHEALQALQASTQLAKRASPRWAPWLLGKRRTAVRPQPVKLQAAAHPQPFKLQVAAEPEPEPSLAHMAVRVGPSGVEVTPTQVELGRVGTRGRYVDTGTLMVRNQGQGIARCRLEDIPAWLAVVPERFDCVPGQTRPVSLQGRALGLAGGKSELKATLRVLIEGEPRPFQVQVTLLPQAPPNRTRRVVRRAIAAGVVTLTLAGLAIWFVLAILPLL